MTQATKVPIHTASFTSTPHLLRVLRSRLRPPPVRSEDLAPGNSGNRNSHSNYLHGDAGADVLVAVGDSSELADRHGLLLDVVLREEAGLPRHHLLDGRWDDELVDVIVAPPRLPLLRRNYLQEAKRRR